MSDSVDTTAWPGAFVVGNTLSSIPFLSLIALSSGTLVYSTAKLHPGFGNYAYFILTLFASLTCVESLVMAVSSLVGYNFFAGLVIGAVLQGLFKNDLPDLMFRNILGPDDKPIGPDLPGRHILVHFYGVDNKRGK